MSKFTVSEYLKRLTSHIWTRRYELVLQSIRVFLVVTFFAVLVATLAECQPFDNYWQVLPDPGPQCRSGYAQLLVMSTCDIITDILLVIFPIPIIVRSAMPLKRKVVITVLFSMSVLLIVITGYRIPTIINHHGRQQLRTLWASLEILASAAVSNALILGSFVRDRGVKKAKYKGPEAGNGRTASDHPEAQSDLVKTMTRKHWGNDSDEDLLRHCRGRLGSFADQAPNITPAPMVARPALPSQSGYGPYSPNSPSSPTFSHRMRAGSMATAVSQGIGEIRDSPTLFDIGGILDDGPKSSWSNPSSSHGGSVVPLDPLRHRQPPTSAPTTSGTMTNTRAFDFADVGGLLGKNSGLNEQQTTPQASAGAQEDWEARAGKRRKSNFSLGFSPAIRKPIPTELRGEEVSTELQDIGGLLGSPTSPTIKPHQSQDLQISDAGGLLSPHSTAHDQRRPRNFDTHSASTSKHSSPVRKSRSRSNSLLRSTFRGRDSSQGRSPASSHRKTRSRSRALDPATAALATLSPDAASHRDPSSRRRSLSQRATSSHRDPATARDGPVHHDLSPTLEQHSPAEVPATPLSQTGSLAPSEEVDTRAHARDWLAKIKAARERQNENHGSTTAQAQARGGEGLELSDVGGLLGSAVSPERSG